MTEPAVPDLVDLLETSPSNWGKRGDDDEVGSLKYLGAQQVRRGWPGLPGRAALRR